MLGILYSIISGTFVSIQGVFNTRVSDKVGLFETTVIVHLIGLIAGIVVMLLFGKGSFKGILDVKKLYLLGGAFGVIVVFSTMKGISILGATYSIAIQMIMQLIIATIIDSLGLFGSPKVSLTINKILGILIMSGGILVYNLKI